MKMRKMAKHVEASRFTVRRAVREDLCLFPNKHRKTQLIPFKKRPVRVKRGMKILAYLEEHPDTIVLWSDEEQWNVENDSSDHPSRRPSLLLLVPPRRDHLLSQNTEREQI